MKVFINMNDTYYIQYEIQVTNFRDRCPAIFHRIAVHNYVYIVRVFIIVLYYISGKRDRLACQGIEEYVICVKTTI